MLDVLSVALGASIIAWAIMDLFGTVFMVGGGPAAQTRWVASSVWRLAIRMHDPSSRRSHSLLRAAGPLIVLLVLLIWMSELTLGWALVFVPDAFGSGADPSFGDRLVFAAKAMIGRGGNSDLVAPVEGGWEALRTIAGATGVTLVSVGLAYVLPVLGGVAHRRSVAATIYTLGADVEEMRRLAATRGGSSFELYLVALVPALSVVAESQRSYPVLHYFHSKDRHAALAPALAMLVEFLRDDQESLEGIDATVTEPLCRAIHNVLEALIRMGLQEYAEDVAGVDTSELHPVGIGKLVGDPDNEGVAIHESRDGVEAEVPGKTVLPSKEWLEAYAGFDGWNWEDVDPGTR